MKRLFGTNGVRGVFGQDMTLKIAHDIAAATAKCLGPGRALVGHDGRHSAAPMTKAVCSAISGAGVDCRLAGLVPTPCLEHAVKALGYSWGIMVTASHNPPAYNGIKPVASNGVEVSRDQEREIEAAYYSGHAPPPDKWGSIASEERAVQSYLDGIISHVNASAIQSRKITVVIDAGNGAQAAAAPALCEMLGCRTITINEEIDGSFSGRGPEPTPENLAGLSDAVVRHKADLGIAFDGDGDRSMLCDETGAVLTGDVSALLLTDHVLSKSSGTVATCINSGSAIEELAKKRSSQVVRTKVGSVEVSHMMLKEGALVGFEENGGYMYGPHNQVRDGAMTAALALEMIAMSKAGVSEIASGLPSSHTGKRKVPCPAPAAQQIVAGLALEHPQADMTDGIKIDLGQGRWVMVRPSGTEPIVRVYAEAESEPALGALLSEYVDKIGAKLADNTFNTNTAQAQNGDEPLGDA